MKSHLIKIGVAALIAVGATGGALAQGGSTGPDYNAVGSKHVTSSGAPTTRDGVAAHEGSMRQGTVGMGPAGGNDSPNGSPSAVPTAKEGPAGDPSRDADAPK